MTIKIAPSILSADFGRLRDEVIAAQTAGADLIHCDVMDGHFVPNITIGPLVVRAVRAATALPLDVHLMIEQPERYIAQFVEAGASNITVHWETCPHLHRTLQQIKDLGAQASVTINPGTPLSVLEEVLPDVGMVLLMTVNPGFGGQSFIEAMLSKIERLCEMREKHGLGFDIEVDGGINTQTVEHVVRAGANVLVAGAAIFAAPEGIDVAMGQLRAGANRARAGM
ncbi:MAG: ribulose-phosphate 3-epimerase [Anaerolineae bacterium]|nr:ribulose-phosphate 3-epimerase [Anaerolineae bacterium]